MRFTRTIRFRLTLTYSLVMFGIGALLLALLYLGLSRSLDAQPITQIYKVRQVIVTPSGARVSTVELADIDAIEKAINYSLLTTLEWSSMVILPVLFLVSLAVSWFLSGRALAPVRHMTVEAETIRATDLGRRLPRSGSGDELDSLAGTLNGMLDRLERSFTAQRRLMGDASHELRNPLAVIRANTEMVLADDDVRSEDRHEAAGAVVVATERMNRLVEDLLATSRREVPGTGDQPVDLAWLALAVADDERTAARQRKVVLDVTIPPGLVVSGDPDALHRVIHNLVVNAVRYAPPGTAVTIGGHGTSDRCRLWVRDEGPGIAVEDLTRVFDRFWRAEGQQARSDGHSGLGLAIVRQIVESHGGTVWAESTPGAGATFTVEFPLPPTLEGDIASASGTDVNR